MRRKVWAVIGALLAKSAAAETDTPPLHYSNFGGVGLLETRSARMAPDRTLSAKAVYSPTLQRYALTLQATPWMEGTLSYQDFDISTGGSGATERFDHQFDLKFRLIQESKYRPEIAIGLQDFLGTSIFSGEYIVANKQFGPLDFSLGVGWGRLGSRGHFRNPLSFVDDHFDNRDSTTGGSGEVNFGQFFRGGDTAIFGGIVYDTPIKGLRFIAEYNSDDRSPVADFDDRIPFNLGVSYIPFEGVTLDGFLLHGSELGLSATFSADVSRPPIDAPKEDATLRPFAVRDGRGFDANVDALIPPVQPPTATPLPPNAGYIAQALSAELDRQGLILRRVIISDTALQVSIENKAYRPQPQAIGRTTRILSDLAPEAIEEFRIILVERGMQVAEVDVNRERLESSARERGYTASPPPFLNAYHTTDIDTLAGQTVDLVKYPRFTWSLGPQVRVNILDPDNPLHFQIDALAQASIEVANGAYISGVVRGDLFGNFDNITRVSDSVLPHVRSDFARYYRETDINVDRLAFDYFFTPTNNMYARISSGFLEQNFTGVGGELLYRPPYSSWAFGGEIYYVYQRDFNKQFQFLDYNVFTGHGSIYYDSDFYNFDFAIHAGKYLAGDLGLTLEATRRFANGWEIGAFATFTDVSFDDFGEGSFDKGLLLRIPLDWGLPYETRSVADITLRPAQRDGGQRLNNGAQLFRITQPSSAHDMSSQWNEFSN